MFLTEYLPFQAYTLEHFAPIFLTVILGYFCIKYGRNANDKTQRILGAGIAMIPCLSVCTRMIYLGAIGEFTAVEDLPLHLCRFIALLAPFVMYYRRRFWLGILHFWIFIGTLGANVFPELFTGFPSLEYILFWSLHSPLLILPFYSIIVYKVQINTRDAITTFVATNLFLVFCWVVNYFLGSNYFYTMKKPNTAGLLDFLGEYPTYLLTGQMVIVGFILLFYLPFAFGKSKTTP